MNSEEQVINALKQIIDPEIGVNIFDLGLIYDLAITDSQIKVTMTLTTPGCPMHSSITAWVENSLKQLAPHKEINVELVWQPRWTPELMSDQARLQLGYN